MGFVFSRKLPISCVQKLVLQNQGFITKADLKGKKSLKQPFRHVFMSSRVFIQNLREDLSCIVIQGNGCFLMLVLRGHTSENDQVLALCVLNKDFQTRKDFLTYK